jgi:hypothetical protein
MLLYRRTRTNGLQMNDSDEDEGKDKVSNQRQFDKYTEKTGELSESQSRRRGRVCEWQPDSMRRCNQLHHRNLEPESRLDSNWTTAQDASSADDTDLDFVRD